MWRSHLDKLQYSEEENRHLGEEIEAAGGEVLLDQRVRRGGSHHQKLVVLRHPGGAGARRRVRRRHRPVPQPPRRRRPPRRPAGGAHVRARTATARPGTTCSSQLRGPVVGALDDVFRERWTDPTPLDPTLPSPGSATGCARADLSAGRLPPPSHPTRRRAGRTRCRCCAPTRRCARRTASRRRGERTVARGYTKAIRRARRLIYLEDQYLWSTEVANLFAEALRDEPGPAPGRGRAAASRRRRPLGAAAQPGRPGAGDRAVPRGRPATGCTSSTWRTTRARRCTCTPRSASSTTSGPASAATTSTAARGRTTASCPARCWTTRATTGRRPTRPGSATAPGASPATCGCSCCASTSTARRRRGPDLLDPRAAVTAITAAAAALARLAPTAGGPARRAGSAPRAGAAGLASGCGRCRRTGWSTTRTAARGAPGAGPLVAAFPCSRVSLDARRDNHNFPEVVALHHNSGSWCQTRPHQGYRRGTVG